MQTLAKNSQPQRVTIDGTNNILAAGTSDVNSGVIDTLGYGGCLIIMGAGVIATSGTVDAKLQQSADSGGSPDDFSDIAGSGQTQMVDTDDNKLFVWDVRACKKRYLRVATTRGDGGNSTIDFLVAIPYHPGQGAPALHSTVKSMKVLSEPAEGTA